MSIEPSPVQQQQEQQRRRDVDENLPFSSTVTPSSDEPHEILRFVAVFFNCC